MFQELSDRPGDAPLFSLVFGDRLSHLVNVYSSTAQGAVDGRPAIAVASFHLSLYIVQTSMRVNLERYLRYSIQMVRYVL